MEVAVSVDRARVRDSKNAGPLLVFRPSTWRKFVAGLPAR
ncbi:DUF397 domain-containing protein [Umezawaea beigongshangensis]|nr:DUF397 domain-containing protein [Umezawaea beigongshangensis]